MTTYTDDNHTTSNEIELNVETLEEVIAPAAINHNETVEIDLSLEELEEVIAPGGGANHNETLLND